VKGLSEAVEICETMATPVLSNGRLPLSAASSDQLSLEFEITAVDDDILNTVEKLFNFGKSGAIPYETIQDILGKFIGNKKINILISFPRPGKLTSQPSHPTESDFHHG
jgi:hypothetical protein